MFGTRASRAGHPAGSGAGPVGDQQAHAHAAAGGPAQRLVNEDESLARLFRGFHAVGEELHADAAAA